MKKEVELEIRENATHESPVRWIWSLRIRWWGCWHFRKSRKKVLNFHLLLIYFC